MIKIIIFSLILIALLGDIYLKYLKGAKEFYLKGLLILVSSGALALLIYLFINHVNFPLNLEVMETVVLQHARRVSMGKSIYPAPNPTFIALAYNPLYYILSVPYIWVFGQNLFSLRLVAIIGAIGTVVVLYKESSSVTGSKFWGLVSVGLFAISYLATDAYLDTAHSDTWFIFTGLLGFSFLNKDRSRRWDTYGLALLLASFWFKQHGALFVVGGLLLLSLRYGIKDSIIYWGGAIFLGFGLYVFGGPNLFGSHMLEFTLFQPMQWSYPTINAMRRCLKFVFLYYPILFAGSVWSAWKDLRHDPQNPPAWTVFWLVSLLATILGLLDPGSANNIFIPFTVSTTLLGVIQLSRLEISTRFLSKASLRYTLVLLSFVPLIYNPASVTVSGDSKEAYDGFIQELRGLQGQVFAPNIGQLPSGYSLYPAVHWVALEDMIRGPGVDISNHPNTKLYLKPAIVPDSTSFLILSYHLEQDPLLGFLSDCYHLEADWGQRFSALDVLPGSYSGFQGYPRYLYKYSTTDGHCAGF